MRLVRIVGCVIGTCSPAPALRRRLAQMACLSFATLSAAGCAQRPQQLAAAHGKEYFPSSTWGPASPRVVADGQPIPRGGGQYLVGKPYTVAGQTYYPSESRYSRVGLASWYGDAFHGRRTANGEIYDRDAVTAAHPTMPLPSFARVTNLSNHYSMIVRVNDRGPFHPDRIMDVSHRTAEALQFARSGTARVKVEYIAPASLNGSDDDMLLATLRTDGPAALPGETPSIRMADAPAPRPAVREARIEPKPEPHLPPPRRPELRPRFDDDERPIARRSQPDARIAARTIPEPPHAPQAKGRDATRMAALVQAAAFLKLPPAKGAGAPVPKTRPLDLATIPGAGVPIGTRQHQASR